MEFISSFNQVKLKSFYSGINHITEKNREFFPEINKSSFYNLLMREIHSENKESNYQSEVYKTSQISQKIQENQDQVSLEKERNKEDNTSDEKEKNNKSLEKDINPDPANWNKQNVEFHTEKLQRNENRKIEDPIKQINKQRKVKEDMKFLNKNWIFEKAVPKGEINSNGDLNKILLLKTLEKTEIKSQKKSDVSKKNRENLTYENVQILNAISKNKKEEATRKIQDQKIQSHLKNKIIKENIDNQKIKDQNFTDKAKKNQVLGEEIVNQIQKIDSEISKTKYKNQLEENKKVEIFFKQEVKNKSHGENQNKENLSNFFTNRFFSNEPIQNLELQKLQPTIENQIQKTIQDAIDEMISRARIQVGNNGFSAQIRLNPSYFGYLSVDMKVQDNQIVLKILVDNKEIFDKLQENIESLKNEFLKNGFQIENVSIKMKDNQFFHYPSDQNQYDMANQYEQDQNLYHREQANPPFLSEEFESYDSKDKYERYPIEENYSYDEFNYDVNDDLYTLITERRRINVRG